MGSVSEGLRLERALESKGASGVNWALFEMALQM
jgi:hypothetical protein